MVKTFLVNNQIQDMPSSGILEACEQGFGRD